MRVYIYIVAKIAPNFIAEDWNTFFFSFHIILKQKTAIVEAIFCIPLGISGSSKMLVIQRFLIMCTGFALCIKTCSFVTHGPNNARKLLASTCPHHLVGPPSLIIIPAFLSLLSLQHAGSCVSFRWRLVFILWRFPHWFFLCDNSLTRWLKQGGIKCVCVLHTSLSLLIGVHTHIWNIIWRDKALY